MNVFLRELSAYRRSTITWVISLSVMVLAFMAGMYPAFTQDVEATRNLLSQLPEAVRVAFSISLANFFTVYGFYAYLLNFALLAGAIQAMNLGTGVISKEVSGKTADFLLSKPLTRPKVLSYKLGAALSMVLFTSAVFAVVSYVAALIASAEAVSATKVFLLAFTFLLAQLFFLALGALFAVLIPKVKSVISVTLPTVFAFYIVGTLGDVLGQEAVRYASPFKFFDSIYVISNKSLEGTYLAFEIALVVAAIVATYVIYLKKDIPSST